jgi:hypothetical protein
MSGVRYIDKEHAEIAAGRVADLQEFGSELPEGALELLQAEHMPALVEKLALSADPLTRRLLIFAVTLSGLQAEFEAALKS